MDSFLYFNRYIRSLVACSGLAVAAVLSPLSGRAQENSVPGIIYIEPLFEYPVAPEDLATLEAKSNWLMQHFWDSFDFKNKSAVDQNALNDAFSVWSNPMQWADKGVVLGSTDRLISNIGKNPTMVMQFTKAAEENLYGPRAMAYIDEVYVKFLEAMVKNKKLPEARKARYARQLRLLKNTLVGSIPPSFKFQNPSGATESFRPGLLTVIEFGDPGCSDCRHAKLKMDTDLTFSSFVEKGKINVLFIIPDPEDGWEGELSDYPKLWHTGASDEVSDIYDMRSTPYFYVLGTDGKIIDKSDNVERAMAKAIENVK